MDTSKFKVIKLDDNVEEILARKAKVGSKKSRRREAIVGNNKPRRRKPKS